MLNQITPPSISSYVSQLQNLLSDVDYHNYHTFIEANNIQNSSNRSKTD